jgi:hypothetical protein
MFNGQQLMNFGAMVANAQNCKCSYCVAKEDVCYNPEYCYMVKLIAEIAGPNWWNNQRTRWIDAGHWNATHPLINGRIVEHKVVPIE